MATRLKKLLEPMLKDECNKAFKRGFEEGNAAGFGKKIQAYENEIECLKKQLDWAILRIKQLAEKT